MAKRILVPVDRDELAESVLPLVGQLARQSGGTVRLLHVAPLPAARIADNGRVVAYESQEMERIEADRRDYLEKAAECALEGLPVEAVVRFGDPVTEIIREAEAFGADLVALGTARRSWLARALGSVADRVFRKSGTRVLLLGAR
jgi:nucleotide-binding universal stress UspA family protein